MKTNSWFRIQIHITAKIEFIVSCPNAYPYKKFHETSICNFLIILLDKQTNQRGKNSSSLAEVINTANTSPAVPALFFKKEKSLKLSSTQFPNKNKDGLSRQQTKECYAYHHYKQ